MKKLSFLALAIAGMLFGACSSDKDVAEDARTLDQVKGNGFFKVNLNLPTNAVTSTRADGWGEALDGNLDNGLPQEYAVNSLLLLIFDGENESEAALKQVINLTKSQSAVDDTPNQITTKGEYVAKLNNAPSKNLYALAVVNGTGIIEMGTTDAKVKISGGAEQSGIKLSDLQASTTKSFINSNNFFMTNAVLSKSKGGATDPGANPTMQILAPINPNYLYPTQTEAENGTAATDIYVERGVAKVTINTNAMTSNKINNIKMGGNAVVCEFKGWALDNTQNKSFIVRKVPSKTSISWNLKSKESITTDPYRFVGGNALDAFYGTTTLYRTYWAEDPTYDKFIAADFTTTTTPDFTSETGENKPLYCYENTFDVANQTHKSTTRAVIKVSLKPDGVETPATDFYTIGSDRNTLYNLGDVKNLVVTNLFNQSAFTTWWDTQSTLTLTGGDVTVSWSSTDAGIITVTDVTIPNDKCDKTSPSADVKISGISGGGDIIASLNAQLAKVDYFKGGDVYYEVRIKHFGDDLTPWNSGEYKEGSAPAESTIATIYPDADDSRQTANYLGRYGMVRNNWYELVIGDIFKVGHSTVPDITGDDHPDDDIEELYIKARINILSWAKRVQNWNLK